jgi:hypothetical protein
MLFFGVVNPKTLTVMNSYTFQLRDVRYSILNGASEILTGETSNHLIQKYYSEYIELEDAKDYVNSKISFDLYIKELLKECTKPLQELTSNDDFVKAINKSNDTKSIELVLKSYLTDFVHPSELKKVDAPAETIENTENFYTISFLDKQTAIRNGANELLPNTTTNENISKYYKWFCDASERQNVEKSEKWFNAYLFQLLRECKKPLQKDRTDDELDEIENCKSDQDLIDFLNKVVISNNDKALDKATAETIESDLLDDEILDNKKCSYNDIFNNWEIEFVIRMKSESNSKKQEFHFIDAIGKKSLHTDRDKCFIECYNFVSKNPLRNNDYFKYVNAYIKGIKLNLKYFRHSINDLKDYYSNVDKAKAKGVFYNPFSVDAYNKYVLFMVLKLRGFYLTSDDELFSVTSKDNREYNPLTKIPYALRGELPFDVKEYDIKRAFPTFIDIELDSNFRTDIYEKISKKEFASCLNSNVTTKNSSIESLRKSLSVVYGSRVNEVLTDQRFNIKGQAFKDFTKYEKQYIERFISENKIANYVRLHDGIFVLSETECSVTKFDTVEFSLKECIKPPIENEIKNFYYFDCNDRLVTTNTMYADFFIQENIKRISTADDKIQLLKDTNNVVDFYNHNTDIVSLLQKEINEYGDELDLVRQRIASDCNSLIAQSFKLIDPIKLKYYSDSKSTFGLPFKNGFHYFIKGESGIKVKDYKDVDGFFSPHPIQSKDFTYTDEVGMFERFLNKLCIGMDAPFDDQSSEIVSKFQQMFGYLSHTYKDPTASPCIVLTDEGADDENRNGRRGKTLLTKAVEQVQPYLYKGGKEFDPNYTFAFADLEKKHNIYIIDDVPAGFKYDDLYTNILGSISCQRKGLKAELIEFKDVPKFVITSNWVLRYNAENASTNMRFMEFKASNFYNKNFTPKQDFGCTFFVDWNTDEWNKFYSFVFRCVDLYLTNGIQRIEYDKTIDNYLASFNNDSMLDEFERILNELLSTRSEFGVNDFLIVYDRFDNPMRVQKFFTKFNVKKLIEIWIEKNNANDVLKGWKYLKDKRKWINKSNDVSF